MTNSDETPDESNGNDPENKDAQASDSNQPESTPPESTPPESTPSTDSETPKEDPDKTKAEADDELPEWEPLTPELAEEEAMRGDFMLRWAVVLMAFLMACTEINTSATLTHIKSGEQLADNGYLPTSTDTLSYATSELKSSNLTWLFDVTVAQIHSAAGPMGLTLFKALLIAIAFYALVNTSIPGVSTWWNAICCAVALIAAYPRFSATPDVITLFGLALTFRWLQNWRTGVTTGFPWKILVLFVLWANMDARMYLGVVLVLAYAIGDQLSNVLNKSDTEQGKPSGWLLVILCLVCACANPSTFETLTSPLSFYQTEYPALRDYHSVSVARQPSGDHLQYYSAASPAFWKWLDPSAIAALAIVALIVVLLIVNPKGIESGHVVAALCFVAVALLTTHEMGALAVVGAGIAAALGQKWYRGSFSQEYTVEAKELIFSRGGRAVTVLALFAMAFLFASGRITSGFSGDAARVGLGFEPNLQSAISGLEKDLEDVEPEVRIFNFTMEQGDLLAWIGRPHFLDSRSRLYAGTPVLADHDATRRALRAKNENLPGSGDPTIWKKTFADYGVHVATPRMYGKTPDLVTFRDLSGSPDWKLLQTGASIATFAPVARLAEQPLKSLAKVTDNSLIKAAFRTEREESVERPDFAREPGFNEKYVFPPRSVRTDAFLRARNYHAQLFSTRQSVTTSVALAYLTIQNANEALANDPNNADAFRLLANVYEFLAVIESQQFGAGTAKMRSYQKMAALSQALIVEPDDIATLDKKMQAHAGGGQVDLALPIINQLIDMTEATNPTDEAEVARLDGWYAARDQIQEQVDANSQQVDSMLESATEEERAQVAVGLSRQLQAGGFVNKAMSVLGDPDDSTRDAYTQVLYGSMLLDSGRIEEASTVLQKIRGAATARADQYRAIPWHFPCAMSSLVGGSYANAKSTLNIKSLEMDGTVIPERLEYMMQLAMLPGAWSTRPTQSVVNRLATVPFEIATLRLHSAICSLEEGKPGVADSLCLLILKECPGAQQAPLARFYHELITGKPYELEVTDDWIALAPDESEEDGAQDGGDDKEAGSKEAEGKTDKKLIGPAVP